ncbi:MAG TPA: anhydro-N-acetylmuramic acid kinase [Arenicellales bacterium]|nr:anhydro-N-acetylmuramic acid kinase [Arenicellales bacterium]
MLYIGLMSGTSADGIDGVLTDLTDNGFRVLATHSVDYSPGVKETIETVIRLYPDVAAEELARLDTALGEDFARAALELARQAPSADAVAAVGSHGQTIYHGPGDKPPRSVQLGDPRIIAERTGLTTIADFRSADLRAGGQGAPLAPAFHNAMFRDEDSDRLIVNIGGIANITSLPACRRDPVLGFDAGPGNTLMDQWCRLHTGRTYDEEGKWAAGGKVDEAFVGALLDDPYFALPPPKSTGREYFHLDWMKRRFPAWRESEPRDVQAGLLEVTARGIIRAASDCGAKSAEIHVCGGGARNTQLMRRLGELSDAGVSTTASLGLDPEWVEACAFAWLAHRRLHGRAGNLPSVTGACREVLLGEIFTPGT